VVLTTIVNISKGNFSEIFSPKAVESVSFVEDGR